MAYTVKLPPARPLNDRGPSLPPREKPVIAVMSGDVDTPPVSVPLEPLADLTREEALYRLWWRTLPDKALARRKDGHLAYWQANRNLRDEEVAWLRTQVRDLLDECPS